MSVFLFRVVCLAGLLAFPALAKDTKEPKPSDGVTTCKKGEDTRIIKNTKTDAGGCDVEYTKGGNTQSVAAAQHEEEYCAGVVTKMRATLEESGFSCR